MIKYSIVPYDNKERIVYSLIVEEPLCELSIIGNLFEDLDPEIEWIEELIDRNVPDYSEEGGVLYQIFLWGSKMSKIAEYVDGKIVGGQEFDTKEFLDMCYAWRDFLKRRGVG